MKKLLLILISLSLITGLFTSCGESESTLGGDQIISLDFWHYYHGVQQTALDEMIREFNAGKGLEKGIIVTGRSYGGVSDLQDAVYKSASGEAGADPAPDMFAAYSDFAYTLLEFDTLSVLNGYFTKDELSGFVPSFLEEGRISGDELYVFPVAKATEIFLLNKTDWDVFEKEAGENPEYGNIPLSLTMLGTWEGLLEASEIHYKWSDAKTETPNDGKPLFGLDYPANFFYIGAKQLGHDLIDPDTGEYRLDEGVLRKLWDSYYVPMLKGYYGAIGRFRSDDVKTGDMLCFVGSSSSAAYFPLTVSPDADTSYDIEPALGKFPVFREGTDYAFQQGAGICVSKTDPVREAACAEFLKWFAAPEQNTGFSIKSAGYFPVTKEAINSILDTSEYTALTESAEKADMLLAEIISSCVEQINNTPLYCAPAYNTSASLRSIFDGLGETAAAERTRLLELPPEEYEGALAEKINDAAFAAWYGSLMDL